MNDIKRRASLISMLIVLILTGGKFIAYFLSGSLTVLTEAWHGFSDVATTLLVLLAIWITARTEDRKDEQKDEVSGKLKRLITDRAELKAAVLIGVALTIISITIMWQVINYTPRTIQNALWIGLFFLLFSTGSFFLYRFQHRSGEVANSPALKADSLHSRADMITAALTGFTLILYHFGVDIDRFVAGFLSLYIGAFSVELLVNSIIALRRGEEQNYQIREIVSGLLSFKTYHILFSTLFPKKGARWGIWFERWMKRGTYFIITALLLYWGGTTCYTIEPHQQGIREHFGSPVAVVAPGFHFKWPWPVDRIVRVESQRIRVAEIGNVAEGMMLWSKRHGKSVQEWLSGDDRFIIPYLVVHYRVKDPVQFHYNQQNPEQLIRGLITRGMSGVFARKTFYDLALHGRVRWQEQLQIDIQQELNQLKSGIEMVSVFLKDLHPPMAVALSYEQVIAANQEQQEKLNDAETYRIRKEKQGAINVLRRRIRGKLYRSERKIRTERELARFNIYDSLTPFMRVIKERLRWESRLKTFSKRPLILMDKELSGIDLRLTTGGKGKR